MVSGHTSPPAGLQCFDPISWRKDSSFAWSFTYSSKRVS